MEYSFYRQTLQEAGRQTLKKAAKTLGRVLYKIILFQSEIFFFRAQPFEANSRKDQDCLAEKETPENASYREKATEKGARPPKGLMN